MEDGKHMDLEAQLAQFKKEQEAKQAEEIAQVLKDKCKQVLNDKC